MTTAPQVRYWLSLSASICQVPSLTLRSGTQRAQVPLDWSHGIETSALACGKGRVGYGYCPGYVSGSQ